MTRRAWLVGLLFWGTAAHTQPAPTQVAPPTIDRARVTASPALSEALASRLARWTFRNDSGVAVTAIRLKTEGAADYGPSLLDAPVVPGASQRLARPTTGCVQQIELRFANGGRRRLTQDLCAEPELRLAEAPVPATAMVRPSITTASVTTVRPVETMSRPPAAETPAAAEVLRPLPPAVAEQPVTAARPAPVAARPASAASRPAPAASPPAAATPPPAVRPVEAAPTDAASPPPEPAPAPTTDAATTGDRVYCPVLEEEVPALVCARATAVDRGVAGVKAKPDMVLGDTQVVRLVVSRTGDSAAVVDELGGEAAVYRQFKLATGRYMEAQLAADSGLEIAPAGWVRRDLGAGDLDDWEWQVKALAKGRHQVMLRTRVMKEQEDGTFIPRPGRESEPQYVEVRITGDQEIEQKLTLFTRWLNALAAPAESLTNLLTLLGTLVAAAGGLWAAIRAFGRKPTDAEGGGG
jgi:hypothetical protein